MHLLVIDAYSPGGRQNLETVAATAAGRLYERMLRALEPEAHVDVVYASDMNRAASLEGYDGVAWTGSDLNVHHAHDPLVRKELELVRAGYAAGVAAFGSCFAAHLAVVAAGGACEAHPRGREWGVAREIELTEAGRKHPVYRGKPERFDALTSHEDTVTRLPHESEVLARNAWSDVQAVAVRHGRGSFWAVQYHPEYDLREVAALGRLRADQLVAQGRFPDRAAALRYVEALEALHAEPEPEQSELRAELEVGEGVLDPAARTAEVRNWLDAVVRPRAAERGRA